MRASSTRTTCSAEARGRNAVGEEPFIVEYFTTHTTPRRKAREQRHVSPAGSRPHRFGRWSGRTRDASVDEAARAAGEGRRLRLARKGPQTCCEALAAANPATAKLLAGLGANTIKFPGCLTLARIAAIRQDVDIPLDISVEGADDFGGFVRHDDLREAVRVAALVHLELTVRNSPGIYPAGEPLETVVLVGARERVRRAAIGLALLSRYDGSTR